MEQLAAMRSSKPTIVHYFHDFNDWGGIVTHLLQALPALQQNFRVVFVGTHDSPLSRQLMEKGIAVYGFPYDELEQNIKSRFILKSLYGEYYLKRHLEHFKAIIQQVRPDIIHTHMGEGDHKLLINSGIPIVRTFHGSFYKVAHQGKNPIKLLYHHWCLSRFSRICNKLSGMTIVSQYERKVLEREKCIPPKSVPTAVIPNGLDLELFQQTQRTPEQTRQQIGIPVQAKVVGLFSRLAVDKNAEAFLSTARSLIQQWPLHSEQALHFLVAGQGPLETQFYQFSQEYSNFHYLGYRTDISTLIDSCDVTVNLSFDEGFGLSVLESISMGCPCVAYAVGGIPEILTIPEHNTENWLVDKGKENGIVIAIIQALKAGKTPELQHLLKAHAQQFSLKNYTNQMTDFYFQVLSQVMFMKKYSAGFQKCKSGFL